MNVHIPLTAQGPCGRAWASVLSRQRLPTRARTNICDRRPIQARSISPASRRNMFLYFANTKSEHLSGVLGNDCRTPARQRFNSKLFSRSTEIRLHVGSRVDLASGHVDLNLMPTSYRPHAELMSTSCRPEIDLRSNSYRANFNFSSTSCPPVPTSCFLHVVRKPT